jgi:hypothetical protein
LSVRIASLFSLFSFAIFLDSTQTNFSRFRRTLSKSYVPPDPRQRAARSRVPRQRCVRGGKVPARGVRRGSGRFHVARGRLSTNQAAAVSPRGPYILLRHRLKVRNYRRNHVASNAVVNGKNNMMEETTMYRKLVTLICAMLLSTAAFGQGGGGGGAGGGAAGGGGAGAAGGAAGTGSSASGSNAVPGAAVPGPGPSTSGTAGSTSVAPFNAQNSANNPATGQPYDPSNINDPNNPSNPLNANQSK